jgi:hypothetical protein
MAMISVMFQSAPDSAATLLAEIFQVYYIPIQEIADYNMISPIDDSDTCV